MSDLKPNGLTVSFDLDGVLIQNPFLRGVVPFVRAHIRESGRLADLSVAEADAAVDVAIREAWSERMLAGRFVDAYDWDAIYSGVGRSFGARAVPDVTELVTHYCRQPGMIELLPGAGEALQLLRDAGCRLVAITNGFHTYQWPVLEALGIVHYFDDVVTPDRVGFTKPDPRIFEAAPSAVHVGDTLLHDVLGPHLAGLRAVWLDATLPPAIREVPTAERAEHPAFRAYLRDLFEAIPYRRFHPEATLENCAPDVVVVDALEAARVIVGEVRGGGVCACKR